MRKARAEDLICLKDLRNRFLDYSQEIIEENYLVGFGEEVLAKENLQDGRIEREVHGGMHAARVTTLVEFWHGKLKTLFPKAVSLAMAEVSNALGLDEADIVVLAKYAGLFHDSARLGEGQDDWDMVSAARCKAWLIKKGLSVVLAELFSMAAGYKDKPKLFEDYLLKKSVDAAVIASYQTLRKLIKLSDCLDIMRCTEEFICQNIFDEVTDISGYEKAEHEQAIIEIVEHHHKFIHKQKDMLFLCAILLPNGEYLNLELNNNSYDLRHKVKYEHAPNVLRAVMHDFLSDRFYSTHLEKIDTTSAEATHVKPVFNPYIHGTNSLVLSSLEDTEFSLLPPVRMMNQYQRAPMGGEMNDGGGMRSMEAGDVTCLGRMNSEGQNVFNLSRITQSYAFRPCSVLNQEEVLSRLMSKYEEIIQGSFEKFNVLMIYYVRARQMGVNEPLTAEKINRLMIKIKEKKQVLYFCLLLGKAIVPSQKAIKLDSKIWGAESEEREELLKAVHGRHRALVSKVKSSEIDFQAVYLNPSRQNIQRVLKGAASESPQLLKGKSQSTSPLILLIMTIINLLVIYCFSYFFRAPKNGNVNESMKNASYLKRSRDDPVEIATKIINAEQYMIDPMASMLHDFVSYSSEDATEFFDKFHATISSHLKAFEGRVRLFMKLLSERETDFILSDFQRYFITHGFPLMLVCKSEEKITLFNFSRGEYRTSSPLRMGADIVMMATDSELNRLKLIKYLALKKISNVDVVLISDLFESQKTGKAPGSPYIHQGGVQKLSWLAAKAVSQQSLEGSQYSCAVRFFHAVNQYDGLDVVSASEKDSSRNFMMILFHENDEKSFISFETLYSDESLLLSGSAVTMIATHSEENRLIVMKCLDQKGVQNIKVILFDDQKKSLVDGKPVESPYNNQDGSPKKEWVSAKAMVKDKVTWRALSFINNARVHEAISFNDQDANLKAADLDYPRLF